MQGRNQRRLNEKTIRIKEKKMSNVFAAWGNVGKDPETKTTQNGKTICTFSIASKTGKDKTSWFNVICFGKTAEIVSQYVKKGSLISVSGQIEIEKYEEKYYTKVIANNVDFLGAKPKQEEEVTQVVGSGIEDEIPF